jgi:peptidoglycan/xylan/chitin deacetylase (PgdA/CDA1 family)
MGSPLRAFQRYAVSAWNKRRVTLSNPEPIVSFTFDDFPRSALTIGGSIVKSYGARGTYYASMGLMDTVNEEGEHFSIQDLRDLLTAGHELGSHTYDHRVCRTSTFSDFWDDALRGEMEVRKCCGRSERGNFAYPCGDVTFTAKARLGAEMRSCRGILGGVMGPFADLNYLRANRLYSRFLDMITVGRLISENCKRKGWLIFYTHDVRERSSACGCSPSEFESVVRTAFRSGSRILTISQALDVIEGPSIEAKGASLSDVRPSTPIATNG